jgi:hypothetical protein
VSRKRTFGSLAHVLDTSSIDHGDNSIQRDVWVEAEDAISRRRRRQTALHPLTETERRLVPEGVDDGRWVCKASRLEDDLIEAAPLFHQRDDRGKTCVADRAAETPIVELEPLLDQRLARVRRD